MLRTKKVKIEISKQGQAALEFMQSKCRGLYNWWIGKLKNGEKWQKFEAKRSLQESKDYDPELNGRI
jgi:putative transposase